MKSNQSARLSSTIIHEETDAHLSETQTQPLTCSRYAEDHSVQRPKLSEIQSYPAPFDQTNCEKRPSSGLSHNAVSSSSLSLHSAHANGLGENPEAHAAHAKISRPNRAQDRPKSAHRSQNSENATYTNLSETMPNGIKTTKNDAGTFRPKRREPMEQGGEAPPV